MTKVRIAETAREFLRHEIRYLRARSPAAAGRLAARITEATSNLSRFPLMGSEFVAVRGARRLVVGDYVLLYDIDPTGIAITDIRHGRMDVEIPSEDNDLESENNPSDLGGT